MNHEVSQRYEKRIQKPYLQRQITDSFTPAHLHKTDLPHLRSTVHIR